MSEVRNEISCRRLGHRLIDPRRPNFQLQQRTQHQFREDGMHKFVTWRSKHLRHEGCRQVLLSLQPTTVDKRSSGDQVKLGQAGQPFYSR